MKWLDALGVSESYQVPDAIMKALMDGTKRHELFSLYLSEFSLDDDPVNVLFQEEHGDRDKFKQDYTPPELLSDHRKKNGILSVKGVDYELRPAVPGIKKPHSETSC